ncbi:MAG: prephenate dehydratase [Candidatus Gastranaerophilales bacterium]|nr:prephenate dehydratase [Candidatus Gastranaerophilales bacterium]
MQENFVENIYYLGPDGSNAYNAMLKFLSCCNISAKNTVAQKTIKSALEALKKDYSSFCVLPIENSIEGIVRETIDNLLKYNDTTLQILGEITLPIKHMLISKSKDKNKITKIISHPQALAQCSNYLYKNYNNAELKEVSSTSYAAQKVSLSDDENIAAIANETCAQLFNLNILETDINDEKDNKTRFYILGRNSLSSDTEGKTAITLSTKNHPGALCSVLEIFSKHNINLTYLDSRPSKKKLGEYLFFMELDGMREDFRIRTALEELMIYVDFIRVLGSFKICS